MLRDDAQRVDRILDVLAEIDLAANRLEEQALLALAELLMAGLVAFKAVQAAREAADLGFPPALRDWIPVNVTIPAVGPEEAAALVVALVWVVTVPFDKGRYWPGWTFRRLCVVHNWFNPLWRFRTSGVTISDPRHPYVVVSNHESFVDMLLISHLPWEMKWLSKIELMRIPVLGWTMWMASCYPKGRFVERSSA